MAQDQQFDKLSAAIHDLRQAAGQDGLTADGCDRIADMLSAPFGDVDTFRAFWEKHALGPKLKPSCLVCGRNDYDQPAIEHMELPGIVVCLACRDAARSSTKRSMLEQTIREHLCRKLRSYADDQAIPQDLQIALGDAATYIEESAPSSTETPMGHDEAQQRIKHHVQQIEIILRCVRLRPV